MPLLTLVISGHLMTTGSLAAWPGGAGGVSVRAPGSLAVRRPLTIEPSALVTTTKGGGGGLGSAGVTGGRAAALRAWPKARTDNPPMTPAAIRMKRKLRMDGLPIAPFDSADADQTLKEPLST